MTKINSIAKNASYLTIALVLQKVISFAYFTLLARNLGPENLGKYYLAISFTTIFAVIIDIGLNNVLTREVAREKQETETYLGNILTVKIPLALISLIGVTVIVNLLGYDALVRDLVYLSAIAMILDSFTTTFFALARGFHNLKYESIGAIIFQLVVMILGLFALYSGMSLRWIMLAIVAGSTFKFFYSVVIIRNKIGIKIRLLFDKKLTKSIFIISIPFGLYIVFNRIFLHLDSVLLSLLAGDRYVGLYQIPFKIIFALQFLPLAFVASFYPAISFYWVNDKKQLAQSFERAIIYLIIISLPIAAGIAAIADKVILIFKSHFNDAILPLQIIIFSLVFIFVNFPIGSLLNACDRQKQNTTNMGIILVVSVLLNLILIPKFQAVGASITVLVANLLMTALGFYWVFKTITFNHTKVLTTFFKTLIASFLMAIAVFYLKQTINIFIVVAVGGVVYTALLFLFKTVTVKDIKNMYILFLHKT